MKKIYIHRVVIVLALLFFIIGTLNKCQRAFKPKNNDFAVYYRMSERVTSSDWKNIYTLNDGSMPFRYAPYIIPTLTWMDSFEKVTAKRTWMLIQVAFYIFGYLYLYRSLKLLKITHPIFTLAVTFILTAKYYIDSLFCGQVSGIIFFFFSMGLFYWIKEKNKLATYAQFIPTTLKIIPGTTLVYFVASAKSLRDCLQVIAYSAIAFLISNALFLLWLKMKIAEGSIVELFLNLWRDWAHIVLADGQYVDSTTTKSQSLNSFILRTFGVNETSGWIWKISFIAILLTLIYHWLKNSSSDPLKKAYSYALAVLSFIIIMPQSFPYTLSNLSLPLCLVLGTLSKAASTFHKVVIGAFVCLLTLPGADIIGYENAQWVLRHSLPLIGIMLMSIFIFLENRKRPL